MTLEIRPLHEALAFANQVSVSNREVLEADVLDAALKGAIGIWADFGDQYSALEGRVIASTDAEWIRQRNAQSDGAAAYEIGELSDERIRQEVLKWRRSELNPDNGGSDNKFEQECEDSANRYLKFRTRRRHPTLFQLEKYKLTLSLQFFESQAYREQGSDEMAAIMADTQEQVEREAQAWATTELRVDTASAFSGIKKLCVCAAVAQRMESMRHGVHSYGQDIVVLSGGGSHGALLYRNGRNRNDSPTVVCGWPKDLEILFNFSDISDVFGPNANAGAVAEKELNYIAMLSAVASLGGIDLQEHGIAERLVHESGRINLQLSAGFCEDKLREIEDLGEPLEQANRHVVGMRG